MMSNAVVEDLESLTTAINCFFVTCSFCNSFACSSSKAALFKMVCTDTPRNPFSRYHGIAMLFLKTGSKSSGTCSKKSFISRPPCRSSVSRTSTMFFPYSTAQRNSCAHQIDPRMPSVMKNKNALQFKTPLLSVSCKPSVISTSTSMKNFKPGRTSFKNICNEIIVSCAFRCKCDRNMSYFSPFASSAKFAVVCVGASLASVWQCGSNEVVLARCIIDGGTCEFRPERCPTTGSPLRARWKPSWVFQ
mmetsp:Transcript_96372/g.269661  ORF Transcript_96372/g.269661 Transcript_96372/m.269661 type:complete len:247 (+) Transcript_96372:4-744(+)